jgi:ABC-type multidrug transport system permease subunit
MGRLFAMMGVAGVIPLAILLVIFWPFVIIWALNTVFSLGIAYTFWTWLAMLVITMTFGKANVSENKS